MTQKSRPQPTKLEQRFIAEHKARQATIMAAAAHVEQTSELAIIANTPSARMAARENLPQHTCAALLKRRRVSPPVPPLLSPRQRWEMEKRDKCRRNWRILIGYLMNQRGQDGNKIKYGLICRFVQMRHGLTSEEMFSGSQTRRLVHARSECWWLARRLTTLSYPELGRRSGGRDHTTVMNGERKYDAMRVALIRGEPVLWKDELILTGPLAEIRKQIVGVRDDTPRDDPSTNSGEE